MSTTGKLARLSLPLLFLAPGCGGPPAGYYPVTGHVVSQGQPAAGAVVTFVAEDGPLASPDRAAMAPTGVVDDEGAFYLSSDEGIGAPPGKYKVLIRWFSRKDGQPDPKAPVKDKRGRKLVPEKPDGAVDRLGGRYMKGDPARLHAEVKAEPTDLAPFDISN